jgi:hypothetical protein
MAAQESKLFTVAKWGLGLGIAWAISPFILGALKGILGLAACVVVGVALVEAWPLFQFVLRNSIIAGWKFVAREAPITSMQNVVMDKRRELELTRQETTSIDADTRALDRKYHEALDRYPDAPETQALGEQVEMFKSTVKERREGESRLETDLKRADEVIERMNFMWDASKMANRLSKRARMSKKQFQELVMKTSADAVMKAVDTSAAQLADLRARAEAQRQAALPPAVHKPVVEVMPARERVPVRRNES